jgi:hypothetical protein
MAQAKGFLRVEPELGGGAEGRVIIEAKITEDDGTARDKVTRVQHLATLSTTGMPPGTQKYEVIACIAGRGFKVRREDMKKLLLATRGKVFTRAACRNGPISGFFADSPSTYFGPTISQLGSAKGKLTPET